MMMPNPRCCGRASSIARNLQSAPARRRPKRWVCWPYRSDGLDLWPNKRSWGCTDAPGDCGFRSAPAAKRHRAWRVDADRKLTSLEGLVPI